VASRIAEHAPARARRLLAAAGIVVVAGALLAVGRAERGHEVDQQLGGLASVLRAVGPLDQPALTGYRLESSFDCLVYGRGSNPYALELCVDKAGRLVEAIDRRSAVRHYYSLRSEPTASTIHVDRAEVNRLLRRMERSS
jgi:hypothetical protein